MAKRPAGGEMSLPSAKRVSLTMPPLDIGPACGEDDLNVKVLQVCTYVYLHDNIIDTILSVV